MKAGWRSFPHTSEAGLAITAPDWSSFYRIAAEGMLALYKLTPSRKGGKRLRRSFTAKTPEDVLVEWLSELNFLVSTKRWIPAEIKVTEAGPKTLRVEISGNRAPEGRLTLACEIKAVTYHGLKVERRPDCLRARIICDV